MFQQQKNLRQCQLCSNTTHSNNNNKKVKQQQQLMNRIRKNCLKVRKNISATVEKKNLVQFHVLTWQFHVITWKLSRKMSLFLHYSAIPSPVFSSLPAMQFRIKGILKLLFEIIDIPIERHGKQSPAAATSTGFRTWRCWHEGGGARAHTSCLSACHMAGEPRALECQLRARGDDERELQRLPFVSFCLFPLWIVLLYFLSMRPRRPSSRTLLDKKHQPRSRAFCFWVSDTLAGKTGSVWAVKSASVSCHRVRLIRESEANVLLHSCVRAEPSLSLLEHCVCSKTCTLK